MISETARYFVLRYGAHTTQPRLGPGFYEDERALLHFIGSLETKLGMLEGENRRLGRSTLKIERAP